MSKPAFSGLVDKLWPKLEREKSRENKATFFKLGIESRALWEQNQIAKFNFGSRTKVDRCTSTEVLEAVVFFVHKSMKKCFLRGFVMNDS